VGLGGAGRHGEGATPVSISHFHIPPTDCPYKTDIYFYNLSAVRQGAPAVTGTEDLVGIEDLVASDGYFFGSAGYGGGGGAWMGLPKKRAGAGGGANASATDTARRRRRVLRRTAAQGRARTKLAELVGAFSQGT
jgi:hypothetical protein